MYGLFSIALSKETKKKPNNQLETRGWAYY